MTNRNIPIAVTAGMVLIVAAIAIAGAAAIGVRLYYSERNLFLIDVPFVFDDSRDSASAEVHFVLPKGQYIGSIIGQFDGDVPDFDHSAVIHAEFVVLGRNSDLDTRVEKRITLDNPSIAERLQQYSDNAAYSAHLADRVLPHPWSNLRHESGAKMSWTMIPYVVVKPHGAAGDISARITAEEGAFPVNLRFHFRLERFIDAM